ncbi:MAG TPA: sensor histidine kinase [Paenibacillus sp.]|uniref:sensor histidine kinase n=1 Tax=Paenibacillus sp. TaxID=58172 RepID=UPI002BEF3526|nr:sensor histidine kinase [Paenibacillus sp.]HUC92410.1 sensor histidine kinase [Paenibacillus sp.]
MFRKRRIFHLLFGVTAALITVLLVSVILITYSFSSRQTVSNTSYYQQALLNELYNKVVIQLNAIEQISLSATRNVNLLDATTPTDAYSNYRKQSELASFLAQITYVTPDIESVYYFVKETFQFQPPAQSPVRFVPYDSIGEESWYVDAVEDTDFVWIGERTVRSNQGDIQVVSFARKVYTVTGEYRGLLLFNVSASSVNSAIQGGSASANRILLDSGNRPIAMIGERFPEEQVQAYMKDIQSDSGSVRIRLGEEDDTRQYLMVWAKQFNSNWTLVEFTPWQEITSGSVRIAVVLLLVGGTAIVFALVFTLLFARQFVKPIRLLLQEMSRNSVNVSRIHLPEGYRNEFGTLFIGYRKLIERIQGLYTSLEEQYARQKEAEIKALQAMINPHFLYNTLDQLNWMAIGAGQEKMSRILELMGRMFRIGLSNGKSLITIREELTHVECYIEIQQIRLGEGLTCRIDVPEEVRHLYIPKMTLQPFIENAVIHGFHGRKEGAITIYARKAEPDVVQFKISDNGAGLKADWREPQTRQTGGYGLKNVRERIHIYFGEEASIELKPNLPSGTSALIRIPVLRDKEGMGE